jgi:hypothetical protein
MMHLHHEADREVEEVVILITSADAGDALRPHSTKHTKTNPAWPQTAAASAPLPPPNASLSLVDNTTPEIIVAAPHGLAWSTSPPTRHTRPDAARSSWMLRMTLRSGSWSSAIQPAPQKKFRPPAQFVEGCINIITNSKTKQIISKGDKYTCYVLHPVRHSMKKIKKE